MKATPVSLACIFLTFLFFPIRISSGVMASECPDLIDVKRLSFVVSVSGDMGISAPKIKDTATKALRRRLPHLQIAESKLEALHSPVFRITVMGASHETRSGIWLGSGSVSLKSELLWMAKPVSLREEFSNSPNAKRDECPILLVVLWEADPHLLTGPIAGMKKILHQVLESDIEKFVAAFRAFNIQN